MPNENPKINAVERSLRYKIQIAGDENLPMSLSERMAQYKVPGVSIAVINQGELEWARPMVRLHPPQVALLHK